MGNYNLIETHASDAMTTDYKIARHIHEAMERNKTYRAALQLHPEKKELYLAAIARTIEVIGNGLAQLPFEVRREFDITDVTALLGKRNQLVHKEFDLDAQSPIQNVAQFSDQYLSDKVLEENRRIVAGLKSSNSSHKDFWNSDYNPTCGTQHTSPDLQAMLQVMRNSMKKIESFLKTYETSDTDTVDRKAARDAAEWAFSAFSEAGRVVRNERKQLIARNPEHCTDAINHSGALNERRVVYMHKFLQLNDGAVLRDCAPDSLLTYYRAIYKLVLEGTTQTSRHKPVARQSYRHPAY